MGMNKMAEGSCERTGRSGQLRASLVQGTPTSGCLWPYISPEGKGIHYHSRTELLIPSYTCAFFHSTGGELSLISKVGSKGAENLHSLLLPVSGREALELCGEGKKTLWPLVVSTKKPFSSDALPLWKLPFQDHCRITPRPPSPQCESRLHSMGVMLQWHSWEENPGPLPFDPVFFPSDHPTY